MIALLGGLGIGFILGFVVAALAVGSAIVAEREGGP